ncbi:hypothetical protein [Georgenia sp. SYP-B2076]|uniref:hypothetical protein n=1 Tax=Georgenia sp. SYP-B2076 TaxID=2495881 RepID=UPI000F8D4B27|nr:hypothetical protein [Georgenia sp. SYP-B2076]
MSAAPGADPTAGLVDVLAQVALVGGTILVLGMTAVALTTWLVVRRIRRSGVVRRNVDRGGLAVRAVAGDAPGRRLARMRLELRRSVEATGRSLAAAREQGRPVGDMPFVAERLARTASLLDEQLRLAEREPDLALKRSLAAGLDAQVEQHGRLTAQLRESVLQSGFTVGGAQLGDAGSHLSLEVDALQAWHGWYGSRKTA